ncbi:efflux RND transporter periplasmic adaptor subunit [Thauera chlorobenzoica]|nr:efflux RND transporter periplasmic adaptor subunit [Thauera chlorobenzoica]SEG19212.1 RND family efflux transporter, MFP subunit [Thauera chlorobenzoica]
MKIPTILVVARLISALVVLLTPAAGHAEVVTARAEIRPLGAAVQAEASVEAVHQATLAAQVPGRIVALAVDAGERVRTGQVLVRIDPAEAAAALAAAEAGVVQAETARVNAKADYERARNLVARQFLSESALDSARARHQAAEAQLDAARAARAQAQAARAHTTVAAPLDGLVAERHIEHGEMAQPGRSLLTVYDPARMRAVADLAPERLALLGTPPLRARVELGGGGRMVEAAAVTVLPAADARTHTVRVRVDLPAGIEGVLPGSFARVHFRAVGGGATVSIPAAAVLRRGELSAVYVADGEGGFGLRQVRLGRLDQDSGMVEVLSGLEGNETLALDPVQAGIQVRAGSSAR